VTVHPDIGFDDDRYALNFGCLKVAVWSAYDLVADAGVSG
jgi:hypothetical protein